MKFGGIEVIGFQRRRFGTPLARFAALERPYQPRRADMAAKSFLAAAFGTFLDGKFEVE